MGTPITRSIIGALALIIAVASVAILSRAGVLQGHVTGYGTYGTGFQVDWAQGCPDYSTGPNA